VLQDVHLEVAGGVFIYLIGRTGSGKTTLLRALYGDIPFEGNEGNVAGYDLKKIAPSEIPFLRRKLGIIFQDFQLLTDRNVRNNLLFVLRATGWKSKDLMEKRMEEVLKLVALENKADKMPHELSGGEQQKVVIARALLNDPLVILADEPTGNLDPEISDEIVKLLQKISREGTSIIMATHDYTLIEKFPARIIRIEKHQLHELD
jgi:cell division transport system ATP-binding protein